jgi:hypothetical protein
MEPGPDLLASAPPMSGAAGRLRVAARDGDLAYDLRLGGADGPVVLTLRPALHRVILDAVLRRGQAGSAEVVTSEFDVALQRGRVVRWSPAGGDAPEAEALFEGPPGSVLWWLRDRRGSLEVRDVRNGRSYVVDGPPAGRPERASARR